MPEVSFTSLLIVALVAVLAPLALGYAPGLRIPAVGYACTLLLGLAVGLAARGAGWVSSATLLAIALSATSLGLVIPVLKDAGAIDSDAGRATIAAATVADFAAILLLSLAFSTSGGSTGGRLVLLGAFMLLVAATAGTVLAAGRSMRLGDVLTRLQDTTAEIRVRLAVLLLIGFVLLAQRFGLESILGAFLAGAVVAAVDRDASSHPNFRIKLEAIGYGFLVPVFFISSGAKLDVGGLLAEPSALLRVPVYLLALLLVRGLPALLYLPSLGRRGAVATGLLQATSLPFIVTATQIGVAIGQVSPVTAAALVCAGLLSVLIFPAVALAALRPAGHRSTAPGTPPQPEAAPPLL